MAPQFRIHSILDIVTSIATLVAVVLIMLNTAPLGRSSAVSPPADPRPASILRVDGLEISVRGGQGASNRATLSIVEFSDFECPFCGRYTRDTYPRVKAELVEKGIVSYSFRHLPLENIHRSAFRAAEVTECAGAQGKFWQMHDALFANQKEMNERAFFGHAQRLSLNETLFRACIDGQMASRIREDLAEAKRFAAT
jgi:protein-disulfide isomerase